MIKVYNLYIKKIWFFFKLKNNSNNSNSDKFANLKIKKRFFIKFEFVNKFMFFLIHRFKTKKNKKDKNLKI